MPEQSYSTSKAKLLFGTSTSLVDLTPLIAGNISFSADNDILRLPRTKSTGIQGMTADAINVSENVSVPVDNNADLRTLIEEGQEGLLMLHRSDAGRAKVIPVVVSGSALQSPSDGAEMTTLTMTQVADGDAVEGAAVTSGTLAKPGSNEVAYVATASSIKAVTAQTSIASGSVGVKGNPLRADR